MPTRNRRPASFLQWYRLGLGVVAMVLGMVMLLRGVLDKGSLPLLLVGLIFLGFGVWRLRAGWKLLKIRMVR